jgi:hypothetical protein
MKLPQAVRHASRILRMLCSGVVPEGFYPDVDIIWQRVERCGDLYWAIEEMKRELASEWYDQRFQGDLEAMAARASTPANPQEMPSSLYEDSCVAYS